MRLGLLLACICTASDSFGQAQEKGPGRALQEGLFSLNQIDLHVHAGKERPLPLQNWIDLFVRDGRRVLLLLDHLELYRMEEKQNRDWVAKNQFTDWYPDPATAKDDFLKELSQLNRRDILLFRGWEIWEGELDEGLEKEAMRKVEVIGWHFSKAAWQGKAPAGRELIFRARQILAVQKEFPVPMILFHPFNGHIKAVREDAKKAGRAPNSIPKAEYRYFTLAQQSELIELLSGSSVYIEIERDWAILWNDPVVREAFMEDIRPLAAGGIKFTVSTDAHGTRSFQAPFRPEVYCNDLGITPENANAIIRELLAIRAKKSLP